MKAFITGGLGQIGSHIAERLLARGDEVLVIDNLATGRRSHLAPHPKLEVIIGTIADPKLVDDTVAGFRPDVLIHTAASYKHPDDWYNDTLTNCVGGANVIQAAKQHRVGRFIYFQTALCYGQKPRENPITLAHPRVPSGSSYAISKTTNELYLELAGIDYVTFRLANVVGPRNLAGPLPIFYRRLKEGKKCFVTKSRRDFVFVKDLAEIVLKACDGTGRGAYHFSSGTDVAIKEVYDAIVQVMKLPAYPAPEIRDIGPDDVYSILLDPSRLFADFGRVRFTPLAQTVAEAVTYYEEFGVQDEYTHLRFETLKR